MSIKYLVSNSIPERMDFIKKKLNHSEKELLFIINYH